MQRTLYYDILELENGDWFGEIYDSQGVTVYYTENCATRDEAKAAARVYIEGGQVAEAGNGALTGKGV